MQNQVTLWEPLGFFGCQISSHKAFKCRRIEILTLNGIYYPTLFTSILCTILCPFSFHQLFYDLSKHKCLHNWDMRWANKKIEYYLIQNYKHKRKRIFPKLIHYLLPTLIKVYIKGSESTNFKLKYLRSLIQISKFSQVVVWVNLITSLL